MEGNQAYKIGVLLAKAYNWFKSLFAKVKEIDIPIEGVVKYGCIGAGLLCWCAAYWISPISALIATLGSTALFLAEFSRSSEESLVTTKQ